MTTVGAVTEPVAATPRLRLGLRENAAQFTLLVAVNALVGASLGQERTVVPLLAPNLDDPDWLDRWARHFGPSATRALAQELRRLPWRVRHQ